MDSFISRLDNLTRIMDGDLKYDNLIITAYSTDASVYKERPLAVVWPRGISDIRRVLSFARHEKSSVTLRAGGTSLAGQVVSSGIIVDISRYMNKILEIDMENRWVRVEPGVVLDELNMKLKEYGLFFGPETSTSNRCNIGGMVGNNACGSHSLVYGSTRDHTIEIKTILSDGSEAIFGPVDKTTFENKCNLENLEGEIYRNLRKILTDQTNQKSIREGYPDPKIHRRNTGYALDLLLNSDLFDEKSGLRFNLCNLLTGSEGTLAVTTEIKLNLVPLLPASKALVCVHLKERNEAFQANMIILKHNPTAVEMMDNRILELTDGNLSQRSNRFFLEGNPGAILIVEFARENQNEIDKATEAMINELRTAGFGYSYPVVRGKDISKVWDLRKAGLGVLTNMKGDAKPVAVIEDTAVNVEQLPEYMSDIEKMLSVYNKEAVFHAHIGTGELHLRPILNLKDPDDVLLFRTIGKETAYLVKKYNGSLSGEHGDGRLRGEFIPIILGEHNYDLLRSIKKTWDPDSILNPGKIINTPEMNSCLRYIPGKATPEINTIFDFTSSDGIIRAAERCNGSADCRKSAKIGGVMCPSFMATGDEEKSTRARANVLREFLNKAGDPWNHKEINEILDLCLACKGCKSECPSGVDIAKIKSEYLQHWYDRHGIPLRTLLIGYISSINRIGSHAPSFYNFFLSNRVTSAILKRAFGFASGRSIPLLYKTSLRRWIRKNLSWINPKNPKSSVCLFIDEFTNYNDTEIGIIVIKLLTELNYKVVIADHKESARTFISKGMLRRACRVIRANIRVLSGLISKELPLVGIEPSAILGFRDEYPELAGNDLKGMAEEIASNSYLIEEFIVKEFRSGSIKRKMFTEERAQIVLHAHCQQKSIASSSSTLEMLSIPLNYSVSEIPSGCCGMAGSFGYEKEHFELSKKIGELVLFPEIMNQDEQTIVVAPGTSCRHHIKDGTGRIALHPAVVLYNALKKLGGERENLSDSVKPPCNQ
jgi:FAD/FMN-containing dehydrogenase/Fe-S oxidoreductase